MKIEFSFQRREMLLFLTTNMAAVTSVETSNRGNGTELLHLRGQPFRCHVEHSL